MAKAKFDFIGMVMDAPEDQRDGMLAQMANMTSTPVSELMEELTKRLNKRTETEEQKARRLEREERNKRVEAVTATVESLRDDIDGLRVAFEEVSELEGLVVLSGFDSDTPTFTVAGLKVSKRGGGTGGGKPSATQPRPYVDEDNERIFGQLPKWAEDKVGLAELEELSEEHEIDLSYSAKTGKLGSKNLAKLLLKAELISKSEVTADELATFEASRD